MYRLDIPAAPEGAAEIVPAFESFFANGNVSVRLHSIEWWDAHGRRIQEAVDV